MDDQCSPGRCGLPNQANWYISVVFDLDRGYGPETDYNDVYRCDAHKGDPRDYMPEGAELLDCEVTRLR